MYQLINAKGKTLVQVESEILTLVGETKNSVIIKQETFGDWSVPNCTVSYDEVFYESEVDGFKVLGASEGLLSELSQKSFLVNYRVGGVKIKADIFFYAKGNAFVFRVLEDR